MQIFDIPYDQLSCSYKNYVIEDDEEYIKINLGYVTIESVDLPLILTVDTSKNGWIASINIPPNYPLTEYRRTYPHDDILFSLTITLRNISKQTVESDIYGWQYNYERASKLFNLHNPQHYMIIHSFYMFPVHYEDILLTDSETQAFKGMGKKILTLVIWLLFHRYGLDVDIQNTLVMLEASGGTLRKIDLPYLSLLLLQRISYKDAVNYIQLRNNEKLIQYYITSYGFIRVDDVRDNSDLLAVNMDVLLSHLR